MEKLERVKEILYLPELPDDMDCYLIFIVNNFMLGNDLIDITSDYADEVIDILYILNNYRNRSGDVCYIASFTGDKHIIRETFRPTLMRRIHDECTYRSE